MADVSHYEILIGSSDDGAFIAASPGSQTVSQRKSKTTHIRSHCSRCITISFVSIRRLGRRPRWLLASLSGFGK